MYMQILFILLLLTFAAFFVMQFYNIVFRGFAPFISTRHRVLKKIIAELEMKVDAIVYELGCGKAGFLRAMRKKYPQAKLVGIEYSFLPYLIARIQNSIARSRLEIRKKNIFKVDLSEADVIYCYLNVTTMQKLAEKFKNECKDGTIIISYQFPLPNTKAEKMLEVREKKDRVYFYRING